MFIERSSRVVDRRSIASRDQENPRLRPRARDRSMRVSSDGFAHLSGILILPAGKRPCSSLWRNRTKSRHLISAVEAEVAFPWQGDGTRICLIPDVTASFGSPCAVHLAEHFTLDSPPESVKPAAALRCTRQHPEYSRSCKLWRGRSETLLPCVPDSNLEAPFCTL